MKSKRRSTWPPSRKPSANHFKATQKQSRSCDASRFRLKPGEIGIGRATSSNLRRSCRLTTEQAFTGSRKKEPSTSKFRAAENNRSISGPNLRSSPPNWDHNSPFSVSLRSGRPKNFRTMSSACQSCRSQIRITTISTLGGLVPARTNCLSLKTSQPTDGQPTSNPGTAMQPPNKLHWSRRWLISPRGRACRVNTGPGSPSRTQMRSRHLSSAMTSSRRCRFPKDRKLSSMPRRLRPCKKTAW